MEALLEAATDILGREGYAKLTTNRIAERAGVNIASLYQYFPSKEAIVAELRRRHGAEQRAGLRKALADRRGQDFETTLRALVSMGVAGHARSPKLQRALAEELPALSYRDVEEIDAPLFDAMRHLLRSAGIAGRHMDLTLWMISTVGGAVVHRAAVERPEDLANGVIMEELVRLLSRYLRDDSRSVRA